MRRAISFSTALVLLLPLAQIACGGSGSDTASGGQDLSAKAAPAKAPASTAAKPASGAAASGPATVSGPYSAFDSDANTVDVIEFDTNSTAAFILTPTDPQTGVIQAAHPSKFNITWKNATDGSVFSVDFASGKPDAQACGTVTIHPGAELVFSNKNSCGLLAAYDAAPYKTAAKDSEIDFIQDGFDITPLDPATGEINAAHPNEYSIKWSGPTTGDVTSLNFADKQPDATSCGKITIDPVKKTVVITGCDDSAATYQQ